LPAPNQFDYKLLKFNRSGDMVVYFTYHTPA
jgi:hypothetical protein